jgi:hypothetical protein
MLKIYKEEKDTLAFYLLFMGSFMLLIFLAFIFYKVSVNNLWNNSIVWLVIVFVLYVINIFVFGIIYYSYYLSAPTAFSFNSNVSEQQIEDIKLDIDENISKIPMRILLLKQLEVELDRLGRTEEGDIFQYVLESHKPYIVETAGCIFKYYCRHVHVGQLRDFVDLHIHTKENTCAEIFYGNILGYPEATKLIKRLEYSAKEYMKTLENTKTSPPLIWSYWDFLYFSTITQTTVGYGDILPNSTGIRKLVTFQILIGLALVAFVINIVILKTSLN